MSKIQDALKKIQRDQSDAAGTGAGHDLQLGRVNETIETAIVTDADGAAPFFYNRYRGPKIELDIEEIRNAGLLGPADRERELQDEYRQIKRPLLRNAAMDEASIGEAANIIMVCSAESGDGKSFTSINLSFSLAVERDIEVLLVDADILKPQISGLFGLQDRPGLTDLLEDDSIKPDDVISPTDIGGLAVSAGRRASSARHRTSFQSTHASTGLGLPGLVEESHCRYRQLAAVTDNRGDGDDELGRADCSRRQSRAYRAQQGLADCRVARPGQGNQSRA